MTPPFLHVDHCSPSSVWGRHLLFWPVHRRVGEINYQASGRTTVESTRRLPFAGGPAMPPTHFPIVRGSAIDAHGWSAGDTPNPFRIIELEMVARAGIEPATRGFAVLRHLMLDAASPKAPARG